MSTSWAGGGLATAFGEVPEAVLKHVLSFSFRAQGCSTRCGGASAILRACFIGNRFPQEGLILLK